jgi:acyl-CoA dehydrogenase
MVLGTGRGFEIAQGRLGPGRLHHCMRAVGIGEAALARLATRVQQRRTFGAVLAQSPLVQAQVADAWLQLHHAWLCVLHAASELDRSGNKAARLAIMAAKVAVPQAVLHAIDTAIQLHGAAGVSQDEKLAGWYGAVRTLRLADGPDEVHLMAIGKQVIKHASKL